MKKIVRMTIKYDDGSKIILHDGGKVERISKGASFISQRWRAWRRRHAGYNHPYGPQEEEE